MTEVWRKVENSGRLKDNVKLPRVPLSAQVNETDLPQFPSKIKAEPKMYPEILKSLTKTLNLPKSDNSQGAKIWQTDRANVNGYEGKKPDFVATVDVAAADLSSIIAPWEVKVGRPTRKDFGQLYGYVHALIAKQPARRKFVGVLQNRHHCYVIILERDTQAKWTYQRSIALPTVDVLSWFRYYVITSSDYSPHFPKFSYDLGELKERLGDPAFCAVGMFTIPDILQDEAFAMGRWVNDHINQQNVDQEHKCVVVKRFLPRVDDKIAERPVKDEIEILVRIEELRKAQPNAVGPKFLPDLLFYSLDLQEFGILPVGTPLHPEQQRNDWPCILGNVLSALEWIHSNNIVHRDVRWSNIVHYVDHAVLVDFGEAIELRPDQPENVSDDPLDPMETHRQIRRQIYCGGLLCCPPRMLGLLSRKYKPQPADDLHAFVLLANMLLWPKLWTSVNPRDVLDANSVLTKQLKRFWLEMTENRIWKPYVQAAVDKQYSKLEAMGGELCVFLGSRAVVTVDEAGGESDWEFDSGMDSLGMSYDSLDDGDDETTDEEDEGEGEDEDSGAEE